MRSVTEWLWQSDARGACIARAGLAPAAWGVSAVAIARASAYHAGWLRRHALPLPSVSVGNLTVGGTGKTPLASWIAGFFQSRGLTPAILLRGYGGDEGTVHQGSVPGAIVIESPDRLRAAARAATAGADVLVLDDAFQRMDVARDLDLVLVAAESIRGSHWTLPAGPWRERWGALARASGGIVTRKSASSDDANEVVSRVRSELPPGSPVAVVELRISGFEGLRSGARYEQSVIRKARILAVAGIGNPASFREQLETLGATVDLRAFGDHHAYRSADVETLIARSRLFDRVVVTAKDAVKLARLWPGDVPEPLVARLQVHWVTGREEIESALDNITLPIRGGDSRCDP